MIGEWEKSKDEPTDKFIEMTLFVIDKVLKKIGNFKDKEYREHLSSYICDHIMSYRDRFKPDGGNGSIVNYYGAITRYICVGIVNKTIYYKRFRLHKRNRIIKQLLSEYK